MKYLFICLGSLCVALAIAGVLLPVLPTTPFLLLAAILYARSSERLYSWLINHRVLGPYIRNYLANRIIPNRAKVASITMLWTSILLSAFLATDMWWLRLLLIAIAIGVTLYILSFKSYSENE